jgi:hypothetical protein
MAEENQKEMSEAGNFIKQEKEVEGLLQAINDKKEASKLMRLEIENLKEEFNRKEKLAKDMEAKKQAIKQEIEKSTEGKPDKRQDTAKLTDEKRNQYTTQIETNFFEFGKIKAMLEIKEKERVNELPGSGRPVLT